MQLDGIITVVDAEQIFRQMKETEVAGVQISLADTVLLNKTDLVDDHHLKQVMQRIRRPGSATLYSCRRRATNFARWSISA